MDFDRHVSFLSTEPSTSCKNVLSQMYVSIVASWICLDIGYHFGYPAPAYQSLQEDFGLKYSKISTFNSLLALGGIIGSFLGGILQYLAGRKTAVIIAGLIILTAEILMCTIHNYLLLCFCRLFMGISFSIVTTTVPVYLAEISQPNIRSWLSTCPITFCTLGLCLVYLFGIFFNWKVLLIINLTLTKIPFFLLIWTIPESPRWYICKGKMLKAKKALLFLRSKNIDIDDEFDEMLQNYRLHLITKFRAKELFTQKYLMPIFIISSLVIFLHMTGVLGIVMHITKLLELSKSKFDVNISALVMGVVNCFSLFFIYCMVENIKRKYLLIVSCSLIIAILFGLGGFYYSIINKNVSEITWIPVLCFSIYLPAVGVGLGMIPWLLMGEILPIKYKTLSSSFITLLNWCLVYVVTQTIPYFLQENLVFCLLWFFGGFTVIAIPFIWKFLPDTRGTHLEMLENWYRYPEQPTVTNTLGGFK